MTDKQQIMVIYRCKLFLKLLPLPRLAKEVTDYWIYFVKVSIHIPYTFFWQETTILLKEEKTSTWDCTTKSTEKLKRNHFPKGKERDIRKFLRYRNPDKSKLYPRNPDLTELVIQHHPISLLLDPKIGLK